MELISPSIRCSCSASLASIRCMSPGCSYSSLPRAPDPNTSATSTNDSSSATTSARPSASIPRELLGGIANLTWAFDRDLDLEYHLRRSALPSPGRVRELLELTSRLHGTLLDRHRPLWETHLVEGLNDGRFAVYTKIHHALVDGVSVRCA